MIQDQPLGNALKMWYLKNNVIGDAVIRYLPLFDNN